jgi:hypothetical protein
MSTIPVKELSKFLMNLLDESGKYEVVFNITKSEVHDFCLVSKDDERRERPGPPNAPGPDDRTLKAEVTLRRIALACLHARTTKDFESAVSNIVEAHNDWVADKVDVVAYRAAQA